MINKLQSKPFTLILSGGGALGIAELGVISDLEKEQLTPQEIIGTSMGAIIGACLGIRMREEEIYSLFVEFSMLFPELTTDLTAGARSSCRDVIDNNMSIIRYELLLAKAELESKRTKELANLREMVGIVPKLPLAEQPIETLKSQALTHHPDDFARIVRSIGQLDDPDEKPAEN